MADEEIRVHIVKYPGRTNLVMRYRDPITGKQVARSSETTSKELAAKAAATELSRARQATAGLRHS